MRLTASDIVGGDVLPAILAAFHEAHPGVAIELTLSNAQQDLLRRDADIAVRMARPTQGRADRQAASARYADRPLRPSRLPRAHGVNPARWPISPATA